MPARRAEGRSSLGGRAPARAWRAARRARRRRTSVLPALASLLGAMLGSTADAANHLPVGFGGFNIGQAWSAIEGQHPYQDLSDASSLAERLARDCGYHQISMDADAGQLLLTFNDFVVTELSYITALEPDSELMAVADLVMQSYGQPRSAAMRGALGQATIDPARVRHVELEYEADHPVTFFVSAEPLWQYQIRIEHGRAAWHQNKTYRCARERTRDFNEEPSPTTPPA